MEVENIDECVTATLTDLYRYLFASVCLVESLAKSDSLSLSDVL